MGSETLAGSDDGDIAHSCVACCETIKPRATICPYCKTQQKLSRWHSISVAIKWVASATALISLILGVHQLNGILNDSRKTDVMTEYLLQAAKRLAEIGGHENVAIELTQQAVKLNPSSLKARNVRLDLAMLAVRSYNQFSSGIDLNEQQFSELLSVLNEGTGNSDVIKAADAMAHFAWLSYLYTSERKQYNPQLHSTFNAAFKLDPDNVFAHLFYGLWCLGNDRRPDCGDNLTVALSHFKAAKKINQHSDYVLDRSWAALMSTSLDNSFISLLAIVKDFINEGLTLDTSNKQRLLWRFDHLTIDDFRDTKAIDTVEAVLEVLLNDVSVQRGLWHQWVLLAQLYQESGRMADGNNILRQVRTQIRTEELIEHQMAYSTLRERIDWLLAKSSDIKPGGLGIVEAEVPDSLATQYRLSNGAGALVQQLITEGRETDIAGLKQGDVIVTINGHEITSYWVGALFFHDSPSLEGDVVTLDLLRNGKRISADVTLGAMDLSNLPYSVLHENSVNAANSVLARAMDKILYNQNDSDLSDLEKTLVDALSNKRLIKAKNGMPMR